MKPVVQFPFYYGWVIVVIAALSQFFSGPGQTYANAIFIDYYIAEFGWSRSTVSGLYSAATLGAGFLLFFVGRMIDTAGFRKMTVIISAGLAAACLFNGFVMNAFMLFIGFFFIRLLGQGSMTLISKSLVPQWFIKKRGRALSIAAIGGLVSSAAFPLVNVWLIENFGWRMSWQLLGLSILLIYIPLAFLFVRHRPEEIGLLPDNGEGDLGNEEETEENEKIHKPTVDVSWTVKEAMKTKAFWLLLFCVAIPALTNTGLTFHLLSIFSEQSLSPELAATILSMTALIGFPITFLTGFLLEKIKVRYMLALVFCGEIITIFLLLQVHLMSAAILFGVVWGFKMGMEKITLAIVWPDYFGRMHLGSITGISMAMMVVGSALGPLPFGMAYDFFGGYEEVLWGIMLFPALGIAAALLAKPPEKNVVENTVE